MLEEDPQTLEDHSRTLGDYSRTSEDYSRTLEDYTRTSEDYSRTLEEDPRTSESGNNLPGTILTTIKLYQNFFMPPAAKGGSFEKPHCVGEHLQCNDGVQYFERRTSPWIFLNTAL
jgi:hypothetical protein